jgi:hypothetical protein
LDVTIPDNFLVLVDEVIESTWPDFRQWHLADMSWSVGDVRFGGKADVAGFMMGWTPPTASMCQSEGVEHHLREASVSEVITIGLDIAKYVFHVHGADERGPWGRNGLLDAPE